MILNMFYNLPNTEFFIFLIIEIRKNIRSEKIYPVLSFQ
jgi:hypothetical protein